MDTAPEMVFNELAQLATNLLAAPMAAIAFIDENRIWYKARVGLEDESSPREESLCTHTLYSRQLLLIPDTRHDEQFKGHPAVVREPYVRFYAGIPLRAANNQPLGVLCVMDHSPREISDGQMNGLRLIGRQIMLQLEMRLRQIELQQQVMRNQSALNDTKEQLRTAMTGQLNARSEADDTRERFQFLTENSNDLITRHSLDGTFIYLSPAVTHLLGYGEDELLGHSPYEYCHPADLPIMREQFSLTLEQAESTTYTYRFRQQDGNYIWLETITRTILDQTTGEPAELIANSRDVSARVVTEQALRESEARFRRVVDQAADAMFLFAPNGRILDVNQEACHSLGYRRDQLTRMVMADVDHDYDEPRYHAIGELELGDSATFETQLARKNGELFAAEVRIGRLDSGEYLALARDISQRSAEQEAVAATARQFQLLAQNWPDYLRVIDLATMQTRFSNRQEFAGLSSADWHPQQLGSRVHPDDHDAVTAHVARLADGDLGTDMNIIYRVKHPDGHFEWVNERVIPYARNENEQIVEAIILVALVTEQAQLQRQADDSLHRREREVSISRRIALEIARQPNLSELYRNTIDLIKTEFAYYHVQLFGLDSSTDSVQLLYGHGDVGQRMVEMNHTIPVGVGPVGAAAITREAVLLPRLSIAPASPPHPLLSRARGELAVPIMIGNQLLGVLDVLSERDDELSDEDRVAMEAISNQLATAIDSTRLRRELEGQLRELNHLQRLMSREGWESFQQQRRSENLGYYFDRRTVFPMQNGAANGAAPVLPEGNEKMVTQPIAIRGEVVGQLGLQDLEDAPLNEEDRELLSAISQQVAEAMENARLLEQTQKRAVELETVAQVSSATANILESHQLLQAVVDLTRQSFDLYHAHIYLLDMDGRDLVLAAGAGRVGRQMAQEEWRIPLHQPQSLVARAARERKGIIVNDVNKDPTYLPNLLLPDTRSELAVPMIVGTNLIGVLDVQSDALNAFTQDDVKIQSSLANQIAVALQNAFLFEEQLQTADQLREVDRLKSEFLASMSHELRTPLNSIIGFADVLLEGLDGELNPRMEEDVRLIRSSGAHLRDLIGEILDMSKIEAGKMELRYEEVDFPHLAYEVLAGAEKYAVTHEKTHLAIVADLDDDIKFVSCDRTRMVQILNNLVSNAIKFTDDGSVTLKASLVGENMRVSVEDTGIGLSKENAEIVFEQFRQVDVTLTGHGGSTGLGLPITKSLVELHGGEIWVESVLGRGSQFIFTIPLVQPQPEVQ
ncbi:MAG: GAF domain-containing protein [Anaerolineales bacterium]|nr:GAF domain-containing protein [Anaerolineales bacterium]